MARSWMILGVVFGTLLTGCASKATLKIGGSGIASPAFVASKIDVEISVDIAQYKGPFGAKY